METSCSGVRVLDSLSTKPGVEGGVGQPCGLGWPGSLVPGRLASQWVCVALAV